MSSETYRRAYSSIPPAVASGERESRRASDQTLRSPAVPVQVGGAGFRAQSLSLIGILSKYEGF